MPDLDIRPGAREVIESALTDGLPNMSLRNCHAKGVDSIMLRLRAYGGCVRMFVAWSDAHDLDKLYRPDGAYQLGVHNHKYDLSLHPVRGLVLNYEVTLREDDNDWGPVLYEHQFTSGITGQLGLGPATQRTIARHDMTRLHPSFKEGWAFRSMKANELHTVIVPKEDDFTAWIVMEGPHYNESLFYSPIPEPPLPDTDMYLPMSVHDAEQVLEQVLSTN